MGTATDSSPRKDLPPSASYLLYLLESDGRQTRAELIDATGLPDSTVET